jgi:hypothetical protein
MAVYRVLDFRFSKVEECHWRKMTRYSLQRRNTSEPFVPPNPNELDSAYSISILRAVFGT